jgi:signal transduction histidine kinase
MKQPDKKDLGGDIGTAVHQLRTPLTSIKWVLGILQKGDNGPVNKEQKELIMKTLEKVEYMSSVISDILRSYQMEEGKILLELKKENIEEIIENEIKELSILAESKNIKIIFNKLGNKCPLLNIDKSKIELVINNLLSNAIKYSPSDKNVEIKTEIEDFELKVSFTDEGIGIPDEQQPKIFSKFFRADNAIKTQAEGTGLGLFISKNIMEAHGGDIWFDSHKDKGSTFYITIPIKEK